MRTHAPFAALAVLQLLLASAPSAHSYNNGVAKTPPMGWNSWNHFHCGVSSEVLATTAVAFVEVGLRDVGYTWINTDDCWSELQRDNATNRLVPGKNFGATEAAMKNLSAFIKSKGMKFGIYGAAGQTTCAGRAGGLYHEYLDAQTYADWGAEYLKYDDCGQNNINSYAKFSAMRDGLNRTGVPIVFSYEPHLTKPIAWTQQVGNLWRTGHDIGSNFGSMFSELIIGNSWASLAGPGNWNDDDMLEVGNPGLSIAEQRTHFALWCMVKSPLIIGSDVRQIAPDSLALLKNEELIAINQDELGVQAALTAVYRQNFEQGGRNLLLDHARLNGTALAKAETPRAFDSGSSSMTTCDYDTVPPAQAWSFVPSVHGGVRVQSKDGHSCLSATGPGIVSCDTCTATKKCDWDVSHGYSGESGHQGKANETTAQIKSLVDGRCLKFSAPSRGGKGLYLATCNTDPPLCIVKRCFYSENLGDEEWYLADNGQLIASFVRGDGHQIPPMKGVQDPVVGTASLFQGPVPGLGHGPHGHDSVDRCGTLRGAQDMGKTPMCKNTTDDGKLYISLADIESRCAADARCAGFSRDSKDGPPYYRPQSQIKSIVNDPKWTTWTKGPLPPAPPPLPPPPPPIPNDWFDQVDVPFCLATNPSSNPPKQPPQPPPITASLDCSEDEPTLLVFAGPLSGGEIVVGLVNKCTGSHKITATFKDIGAKSGVKYQVRDVIAHKDLPVEASSTVSATVGEHDISVLRLKPIHDH